MQKLQGAMTALVTPFKNDQLDESTYAKLIQRQIDNAIDAVVPVGTTGESATLSFDEHKRCVQIAIEVCKNTNTKVLAGAGSNNTKESIELAKYAQDAGADGVLCVAPYYNKPNQQGLYEHYMKIANSVEIDVMPYNVPGRTVTDILPDTLVRLCQDAKNIYSVKEATGSMDRCVEILVKIPDMVVICGDDITNYPMMANGGKGCISVTANILPKHIADIVHLAMNSDFAGSKKINDSLYSLNRLLFADTNPIPIKAIMYLAGIMPSLEYRLPLVQPTKEMLKSLEAELKNFDI